MSKTTIRVRKQRWDYFNRECKAMSLRRDDLLNRLLSAEIAILADMPPCDAVGSRWLKDRWVTMWSAGDFELMNVPVVLSEDVVTSLNATCADKGVPRDAFLDCFLQFLTARLLDPALVIKDPRTERDLGSQVSAIQTDDDSTDSEVKEFLFETASEWSKGRALATWDKGFYAKQLGYDADRVEKEQLMLEAFEIMAREGDGK
jgi:hypothetical protein